MSNQLKVHPFRVFVSTWNVGGKPPHSGLDLDEFLKVHDQSDIYILGFQEIVPLNAGNVLVVEDYEPAAKWLALINRTLNKRPMLDISSSSMTSSDQISSTISLASGKETLILCNSRSIGGLPFFQKPSLKTFSNSFRTETGRRLKACNCPSEFERKYQKESCFGRQQVYGSKDNCYMEDDDCSSRFMMTEISTPSHINQLKYSLISCKQMVGIFLTVWIRKELVQHVSHLRTSCIGRGIMGYLGNKGCISVSMSLHQTSFCFICSHLASGQKEGDELRRNSDVTEILKATQFSKSCKASCSRIPERILEHDRVIWLGDLNYRIALSYFEVRKLLEENDWDSLLYNDQLKIEREAGRVFQGWKEGKIYFAPTYKYSNDSDTFAGEAMKSQKKRRTPAWCDRILWHGNGIKQLSYIRGDLRFSDHRPVCAVFVVDVLVLEGR